MKENPVVAPVTDGADVADVTSERGVTLKTPLVLGNKKSRMWKSRLLYSRPVHCAGCHCLTC